MDSERKRAIFTLVLVLLLPLAAADTYVSLPDEQTIDSSSIPLTVHADDTFTQVATLTVDASFPDDSLACMRWEIDGGDGRERICRGSEACCSFLGLPQEEPAWDEPLYLSLGAYGAGKRTTVDVQAVYADINLDDLDDLRADIRYSDIQSVEIYLLESDAPTGNVISDDDPLSSIYVEITDEADELDGDLTPSFTSATQQDALRIGIPVEFYQTLTLENGGAGEEAFTLNLWAYADEVGRSILQDMIGISIFRDGELLSETPLLRDSIPGTSSHTYNIVYDLPPVQLEKTCEQLTVAHLLPEGATLLSSELDGPIGTSCTLRIFHDSVTNYHDIAVDFDDLDADEITNVYYVEGQTYLDIEERTISVPSLS